jgi:D-alanyl-D-alanine carboxypeptidase (penicillin-binding protein 5/6)
VQDLLYAMLVGSANDAAQTLSNYLEKKTDRTMVDLMAEAATQLGMSSSQFKDPIGFDSLTTYTTATDVTYLLNALFNSSILDQVGRRLSYGFRSVDGVTYVTHATNKLIEADPELFAIKTGYTTIARGAMISRVVHEGQTFVIIVLGSTDREADTLLLKREVLSHFQW